jgi:hypothetical protein
MKKIFFMIMFFPFIACASYMNGYVPDKNTAAPSAAIAVKISTMKTIDRLYFVKDNKRYLADKFRNYFVLFNAAPGTYVLSQGESAYEEHIFTKSLINEGTVTITGNEMIFLGSFKLDRLKENTVYRSQPMMIMSGFYDDDVERTDYYYTDPVKQENTEALKDFVSYMGDKLKAKGWNADQFRLK